MSVRTDNLTARTRARNRQLSRNCRRSLGILSTYSCSLLSECLLILRELVRGFLCRICADFHVASAWNPCRIYADPFCRSQLGRCSARKLYAGTSSPLTWPQREEEHLSSTGSPEWDVSQTIRASPPHSRQLKKNSICMTPGLQAVATAGVCQLAPLPAHS